MDRNNKVVTLNVTAPETHTYKDVCKKIIEHIVTAFESVEVLYLPEFSTVALLEGGNEG